MTSKLKCPFCGEELQQTYEPEQYWCSNYSCGKPHPFNLQGTKELWTALIQAKQDLEIVVDALKSAKTRFERINNSKFANLNNVLQIQCQCEVLKINEALEQIEHKE